MFLYILPASRPKMLNEIIIIIIDMNLKANGCELIIIIIIIHSDIPIKTGKFPFF